MDNRLCEALTTSHLWRLASARAKRSHLPVSVSRLRQILVRRKGSEALAVLPLTLLFQKNFLTYKNMKGRSWCFTVNNYTDDDIAYLMDQGTLGYRYILIGFEVGEEKHTPHLQCYVYFNNPLSENTVRNMFYPNHVEMCKGSPQDNIEYCTKGGKYYEIGDRPLQGIAGKDKIEAVMANPFDNFHLYTMYRKSYKELKNSIFDQSKKRELFMVPYADRYTAMKLFPKQDVCVYPSDWNGERYYITYHEPEWLMDWLHGFPRRDRRGYELYYFDPDVVIFLYMSSHEYNVFKNNYLDYVDTQWGEDLKGLEIRFGDVSVRKGQ